MLASYIIQHVVECVCNVKLNMLFNLETQKYAITRQLLNYDFVNQFDLSIINRIAQFDDTLTLEHRDTRVSCSVYSNDFCPLFRKSILREILQ